MKAQRIGYALKYRRAYDEDTIHYQLFKTEESAKYWVEQWAEENRHEYGEPLEYYYDITAMFAEENDQ